MSNFGRSVSMVTPVKGFKGVCKTWACSMGRKSSTIKMPNKTISYFVRRLESCVFLSLVIVRT